MLGTLRADRGRCLPALSLRTLVGFACVQCEAFSRELGPTHRETVSNLAPDGVAMTAIHYAKSGELNIAYRVVGDGPGDLVYVSGWVTNVEVMQATEARLVFAVDLLRQARYWPLGPRAPR